MPALHPSWPTSRPRDVVAKAIMRRMRETGADHVWLDARHFGEEKWRAASRRSSRVCREHGIDPVAELIPVAPAAHYACGGVRTDLLGRTSVPGLYACGEVGLHRRARRQPAGLELAARRPGVRRADRRDLAPAASAPRRRPGAGRAGGRRRAGRCCSTPAVRAASIAAAMSRRGRACCAATSSLTDAVAELAELAGGPRRPSRCTESWEATNLLTVASVLVAARAGAARRPAARTGARTSPTGTTPAGGSGRCSSVDEDGCTVTDEAVPIRTTTTADASCTTSRSPSGARPPALDRGASPWSARALAEDLGGGVDVTSGGHGPRRTSATVAGLAPRAGGRGRRAPGRRGGVRRWSPAASAELELARRGRRAGRAGATCC